MTSKKLSEERMELLFGMQRPKELYLDPDMEQIKTHFIYGDISSYGTLDDKNREMITLAVLCASHTLDSMADHVKAALRVQVSPIEIKETLYQCIPYVGFPKAEEALAIVNNIFQQENISLPLPSQSTVDETTCFTKGFEVQTSLFGDVIAKLHTQAPLNQKHIQDYLSAMCFGEFYTREALTLAQRELITLCCIVALGGCENQLRSHVSANQTAGNHKEILLCAVTQCLPYIGFPRTLNAINVINEVIPE